METFGRIQRRGLVGHQKVRVRCRGVTRYSQAFVIRNALQVDGFTLLLQHKRQIITDPQCLTGFAGQRAALDNQQRMRLAPAGAEVAPTFAVEQTAADGRHADQCCRQRQRDVWSSLG